MKKALVVDDNKVNRHLLNALLKRNGYQVVEAENGQEAVEQYTEHEPFMIFMDLMMPVMDGIEACKRIKKLCGQTSFVPIIFVTAVSDEDKLTECIESGGDDFIAKPVDLRVLTARIKSMERLCLLYDDYFAMVGRIQKDQEIAKTVFNSVILADSAESGEIKTLLNPAETFSGDMFLSAISPAGELHVMLADFTGHGLGAAIGALPASDVFKAMIAKGFSADKVLSEINGKLKKILPVGMFMAVQYVIVRKEFDYAEVCICGMPDVFIRSNGTIKQSIRSGSFPLGVSSNVDFKSLFQKVSINEGDSIILFTDGVTEAINPEGELFGQPRLEALLESKEHSCVTETVQSVLDEFCAGGEQTDDISLAEIICAEGLFASEEKEVIPDYVIPNVEIADTDAPEGEWGWRYQLTLVGEELAKLNPIPVLISQLQELESKLEDNLQPLYTILTELYINSLDHGILKLDSELKSSPEGFGIYFNEREKRLAALKDGSVSFTFEGFRRDELLKIKITLIDSGEGFDISKVMEKSEHPEQGALCGRGIFLVHELCQSLVYSEPGNKVEVVYTWSDAI